MTSAPAKLYYTTASNLDNLEVINGQIIFVADTQTICLDMKNQRKTYSAIKLFSNDSERLNYLAPAEGFYYVEETHVLWRYKGGWVQMTPKNLEPVLFYDGIESLPTEGVENTLYCTDDAVYNWKGSSYNMIANKSTWGSI